MAEAKEIGHLCKFQFPSIEAIRQVKTLFSLSGELAPIFSPSRAGFAATRMERIMRNFRMSQVGMCLSGIPGLEARKTYAAWPVWSDSTTKEVKFQPMPKKSAVKLWHRARDFDRQTREKGKHGGSLGHTALQVLHTLLFDFLNYASGRLDPSYAAIARKANVCQRTVATALRKLKDLGVLNWVRRCSEGKREDGRFMLQQDTNAYAVLPDTQWLGYRPPLDPPTPEPGTWGASPPLPDVVTQALAERQQGGSMSQSLAILESDPTDELAVVLARLGKAIAAREGQKM